MNIDGTLTDPGACHIRLASPADIEALRDIERAAGRLFAAIGMPAVAEDEPASPLTLLTYIDAECAWVAEAQDHPVGYALADTLDGSGHLEQVSVHPDFGRRGIGRVLIETVSTWAQQRRYSSLTLLTFRDVPWNGPYYERLGFHFVPDAELLPELRMLREHEHDLGLDVTRRGAMRLTVN